MTKRTTVDQERPTIRFDLEMSPQLYESLESLAANTDSTISGVLRKAIILLELAVDAKRQGKKFGIAEKDQPLASEIIGIQACLQLAECQGESQTFVR
jgi:hypothetical protein